MSKATDLLATYTGDASQLLAAVIELAMSDARYTAIISDMIEANRSVPTDAERASIKGWIDADRAAAQAAIDALPPT